MTKKLLTAALLGASMLAAAPASAALFIGVSINGGAITTVANDAGSGRAGYSPNDAVGGFFYDVSAQGFPRVAMPSLLTQSVNIRSSDGTPTLLSVYITQTDLMSFTGDLRSTFTSNTISGVTATLSSFINANNATYGTTTPLATATFTGTGVVTDMDPLALTGPFSQTVRYDLNFTGGAQSNFNGTVNLQAVPEPATWGMMILGFGLIGAASRRSRKVTTVLA